MNKQEWLEVSKQGVWRYLLMMGVFKLGLLGGILILSVQYLYDTNFSFKSLSLVIWLSDYLVWLPMALFFGVLIALLVWLEQLNKFSSQQENNE